jgi:hypothetical protein
MKSPIFKLCSLTVAAFVFIFTLSNCKKDIDVNSALNTPEDNPTSQTNKSVRKCHSTEKTDDLLEAHPELKENRNRIEAFTTQFVTNYDKTASTRAVVTIPVVFHIVYNTAAQNITDQQVMSQLAVMNKDFRRLNADANSTPSVFKPLAADAEITFCLAQQDPNGNATTGIVRKQTTRTSYDGEDNDMMAAATGGSEIWDHKRYLNIYVCNLTGYLGYAYPPGSPADIDAVAIAYTAFGTTGTATAPFHLGRTVTHEIGHWLNLEHIWGDDKGACTGSDKVADTPNQAGDNSGVPTFPHITCGNTPNGDMFMNYMDYCDDNSQNLFTLGQKARMQALFAAGGARSSLLASNACNAPTPVACGTPVNPTVSNINTTTVSLNWAAVSGVKSYTVQHKPTTGTTWTTVANITGTTYNLTGLTANTAYQFKVLSVCASGSSAYTGATNFTTSAAVVSTGCTDNYEANNTAATAKTIPINTAITAKIGTATDVDWFSITTTAAQPKIKISLTNLPLDYDVFLYKNNVLVGSSENEAYANEQIVLNNGAVGTYQIKVIGFDGSTDAAACYTLKTQLGSANFRLDKTDNLTASPMAKKKKKRTQSL